MQLNTTKALFLLFFCSIAGAMYWYSGTADPLSQQEVEYYISEIEAQSQIPGGKHDLLALREFLETDDGKSFYTVNLYKFYDLAHYDANEQATDTGRRAFDRFSERIGSISTLFSLFHQLTNRYSRQPPVFEYPKFD